MKWRIRFFAPVLVALGSSSAFAVEKTPPPAPTVLVEPIEVKALSDRLVYPALVSANGATEVSSEVEGVVTAINVSLGRVVTRGAALLRIENSDPVYHYAPFTVVAPIGGVVTAIDSTRGSRVTRGKALVTITDLSRKRIKIEVTAEDLTKLKVGQEGTFTAVGEPRPVHITALSPVIDPATGTAPVELEPTGNDGPTAGVTGKVVIQVNKRKGIAVREQAIYYRGKEPYVMVVTTDSHIRYADVTILQKANGLVEVTSSLKAGDRVVYRASGFVADGETVTVQSPEVATK